MEHGRPSRGEQCLPMVAQMKGRMTKMNARLLPACLHIVLASSSVHAGLMRKPPLLIPSFTGKESNFFYLLTQTESEQLRRNPPALQGQPSTDVVSGFMDGASVEFSTSPIWDSHHQAMYYPASQPNKDITLNVFTYITYPWNWISDWVRMPVWKARVIKEMYQQWIRDME